MAVEGPEHLNPAAYRLMKWRESDCNSTNEALPDPSEHLPCGASLDRKEWTTLNRARSRVGKTADRLQKWGYVTNADCPCGESPQTMEHILRSCPLGPTCSDVDLKEANDRAIHWIHEWCDKI